MNIREALPTFLKANVSMTALISGRVSHVIRDQSVTGGAYLVFRVPHEGFGDAVEGDSTERSATIEIVAWCPKTVDAIPIVELLTTLFHGTGGFTMGDIEIESVFQIDRYDGDRVTDQYADSGEYPVTSVFEFHWNAV